MATEHMATEPLKKNPAAVKLGRKGGKKRAANLTTEQLAEIGRKGAAVRWGSKLPLDKPADSEHH